jgi:glutamate racemase
VFVACNAASTVLDEVKHTRVKAKGIIEYGICSVTETGCKTVWVIGGGRTIRSGIFRKKLEEKGLVVTQKITQELSILIEKGDVSSFSLESLIRIYLGGMETNTCLLLACTHYPAALPLFRKVVPENVQILDPSDKASETLALRHNKTLGKGSTQFVTSGIPGEMIARANATFAVPVENVLKVSL